MAKKPEFRQSDAQLNGHLDAELKSYLMLRMFLQENGGGA